MCYLTCLLKCVYNSLTLMFKECMGFIRITQTLQIHLHKIAKGYSIYKCLIRNVQVDIKDKN